MFFFFKQKTAYEIKECDWSSDVCSSDLLIIQVDDFAGKQVLKKNIAVVVKAVEPLGGYVVCGIGSCLEMQWYLVRFVNIRQVVLRKFLAIAYCPQLWCR